MATDKLLKGLNPEQLRAVSTTDGPVLVLAGAGTGKTRVITVRAAHLMEQGVSPDSILAVTFTNKAAAEMRERVSRLIGKQAAKRVTMSTFHSFCVRALRENASCMGLPERFAICDSADQLSSYKSALRELHIAEASISPRELQSCVSLYKNRLQTWESVLENAKDDRDELIGRAWKRYESNLRRSASLDFDDLLLYALRLLREHDDVREHYARRFRYVMVDEYQDTNGAQYGIVRQIAGGHRNLCVVGDDDQSIYGWRGADVTKILNFERDFPGAAVVRLETNYRSTKQILDAANRLIANNGSRHEKNLRSAFGDGDPVTALRARDEEEEADHIVREIAIMTREGQLRMGDIAILFRTQTQPRVFETQLRARAVPYVLVGGMSFFDRKEVRDVLAFLKLVANPDDEVSLLRIINCPPRGVGKTTVERILEFATNNGISVAAALDGAEEIPKLPPAAVASIAALRANLKSLEERFEKGIDLVENISLLLDTVSYRAEIDRLYPDEKTRSDRWQAVMEVLNTAENYVRRKRKPSLRDFLEKLTLSANDDRSSEDPGKRDAVTLMTLHAAKGLEFDRVYLVGVEEGILPHARAAAEDSVEEERRLAYVGITRARRNLTISHAAERARFGRRATCHASRFLYEVKGETPPSDWRATGTEPEFPEKRKKASKRGAKAARAPR